jgi:hypothetical protein
MGLVEGKVGWAGSGQRKKRAGLPGGKGQTGQRGVAWLGGEGFVLKTLSLFFSKLFCKLVLK